MSNNTPTLQDLVNSVLQWGEEKGITGKKGAATLLTQLDKTSEELRETRIAARTLAIGSSQATLSPTQRQELLTEVKDGIGDTIVTLILAAERAGLYVTDCLAHAYQQIKDRKGTMVDGQFVKEQ